MASRKHSLTKLGCSQRTHGGFTLAETLTALGLCVIAIAGFYAASGQAIRIVRAGKETASATQLLQQRLESFHSAKPWANIISPNGVKALMASTQPATANFSGAVETYTVTAYPAGTPSFTVTRNAAGTVSSSGTPIAASQKCVKITGEVTWTGAGNKSRSRTQAALLTKGGF